MASKPRHRRVRSSIAFILVGIHHSYGLKLILLGLCGYISCPSRNSRTDSTRSTVLDGLPPPSTSDTQAFLISGNSKVSRFLRLLHCEVHVRTASQKLRSHRRPHPGRSPYTHWKGRSTWYTVPIVVMRSGANSHIQSCIHLDFRLIRVLCEVMHIPDDRGAVSMLSEVCFGLTKHEFDEQHVPAGPGHPMVLSDW